MFVRACLRPRCSVFCSFFPFYLFFFLLLLPQPLRTWASTAFAPKKHRVFAGSRSLTTNGDCGTYVCTRMYDAILLVPWLW